MSHLLNLTNKAQIECLGFLLYVMGVFFILIKSYLIGFGLIGLAIFVLYNQKPLYTVILKTSSGENRALHTNEQEYLNQVINALNEAIVHRG
ncbi:TPA: DUF6232 family protein [Vibrio cholerae]